MRLQGSTLVIQSAVTLCVQPFLYTFSPNISAKNNWYKATLLVVGNGDGAGVGLCVKYTMLEVLLDFFLNCNCANDNGKGR